MTYIGKGLSTFSAKKTGEHVNQRDFVKANMDIIAMSFYFSSREKGRKTVLEPALALNPEIACLYAIKVIHGRFKMGEKAISKSAEWSVKYARFALKKRFRAAEALISKSGRWSYEYSKNVVRGRLPDAMHKSVMNMKDDHFVLKYLKEQVDERRDAL